MRRYHSWLACFFTLVLCGHASALERQGWNVVVAPNVGRLAFRHVYEGVFVSEDRYARIDVDDFESLYAFGAQARAGYKLSLNSQIALTPLVAIQYLSGQSSLFSYQTPNHSYDFETRPGLASVVGGTELLVFRERLGLLVGIGGGSFKAHPASSAHAGVSLLTGCRVRWPTHSRWATFVGAGLELHTSGRSEWWSRGLIDAAYGSLNLGLEFDASASATGDAS